MELVRAAVITLSSLFTFAAIVPYLIAIAKGVAKPRLVTWGVWTLALAVGGIAALLDRQVPAAVLMLSTAVECGLVVVLGAKHGDRTLEKFDLFCLAGAGLGLVLWLVFRSSEFAVTMTIAVDCAATLPTIRHAWRRPYEETLSTYLLFTASNVLILLVVDFRSYTAAAYPIYVFLADLAVAVLLLASPYRKRGQELPGAASERAPIFSRTATISSGARALDQLNVFIDQPTWSINPVIVGQSTVLTVPVSSQKTGDFYCQYSIDPPGSKPQHWEQMSPLNDGIFTAIVGNGLVEGEYQVGIRAKCELGNWSNSATSLTVIMVHIQK